MRCPCPRWRPLERRTLSAIVEALPRQRQSLLFSATQTRSIKALARLSLKDPQYVAVHEHSATATPARLQVCGTTPPASQRRHWRPPAFCTHPSAAAPSSSPSHLSRPRAQPRPASGSTTTWWSRRRRSWTRCGRSSRATCSRRRSSSARAASRCSPPPPRLLRCPPAPKPGPCRAAHAYIEHVHGAALQAAAPTLPSLSPTQVQYIHGVFSALRPGVSLFCLHGRQKQMKRSAPTTHDPAHAPTLASAADPNAAHAPAPRSAGRPDGPSRLESLPRTPPAPRAPCTGSPCTRSSARRRTWCSSPPTWRRAASTSRR
jgi:hypothetical protein